MASDGTSGDDQMARLAIDIASAIEQINSRSSSPNEAVKSSTAASSSIPPPTTTTTTRHDASEAHNLVAPDSPVDHFVTPPTDQSPEDSLDLTHRPQPMKGANSKSSTGVVSLPKAMRRRSSSGAGAVLARLTSRASITTTGGASTDSTTPTSPSARPKLDMAALTRQKHKYKSGVNWDNPDILGKYEEPYEVSTSPVEERAALESPLQPTTDQQALRELASAGGTKAALAQAKANTIGMPYFPTSQRAVIEVQQDAAAAALRGAPIGTMSGPRSPVQRTSLNTASTSAGSAAAASSIPRDVSPRSMNAASVASDDMAQQQKITPEEAQRRLQSARDAVALSNAALKVSPAVVEQQQLQPQATEAIDEKVDESIEAKRKARRSFVQMISGSRDKDGKKKSKSSSKNKRSTKDSSSSELPDATSATPTRRSSSTADAGASSVATSYSNGNVSPDSASNASTIGRRRRFNDTRELNLVASQLAAEALLPPASPVATVGGLGLDNRHASMMGVLSASPAGSSDARVAGNVSPPVGSSNGGHSSSTTHGAHNSLSALGGVPQPPFAADSRSIAGSSSAGGSPRHGSPRLDGLYEPPRAAFARPSPSGSPTLTQSAKISGLPSDMLTGLNDGPYPFLPPRSFDLSDPFAAPTQPMEFEVPGRPGAVGGRNSLPNTVGGASNMSRSRGLSAGSTQTWSGGSGGGSTTPGRRSVLQMTMHNPEQELQGLTKPPKSGRSTPFGSRAPSRQVTPNASVTNLRELAKEEAEKANAAAKEAAKVAKTKGRAANRASEGAAGKGSSAAASSTTTKGSRMSLFRKNRSTADLNGSRAASVNSSDDTTTTAKVASDSAQQLKPPSRQATNGGGGSATESTRTGGSSQSRLSASNDSMTSRPVSIPTTDEHVGNGGGGGGNSARHNASVQSLVKVPSPSMTSGSGSSHDRSGFALSEGGASGIITTSNVTTPDVHASAAKIDVQPPLPPMAAMSSPYTRSPPLSQQTTPSNVAAHPVVRPPPSPSMSTPNTSASMYAQVAQGPPVPSSLPQSATPIYAQMSQTHDAYPAKSSRMATVARPDLQSSRGGSAGSVTASVDTAFTTGRKAAAATTSASSTHSVPGSPNRKVGKFMSRFSTRSGGNIAASSANGAPQLPTSGKPGGGKMFASRSQSHLPSATTAFSNGTSTPPLPVDAAQKAELAKPRANTKFNTFRNNIQRDWFV